MNLKKSKVLFVFCMIIGVLSVVGCGGNVQKGVGGKITTFDKIKKDGKVTIATEAAYAPFEYMENGKIVGYGSDILEIMVKDMGVKMEQMDLPFQGILPGLDAKKYDIVATSIIATPERAKKYGLTNPIAEGTAAIIKRKGDTTIKTVEDVSGKKCGSQLNSGSGKSLKEFAEKIKANGKPAVSELKEYTSFPEATLELKNGRIDAVCQSLPALQVLMKNQPGVFELVGVIGDKRYISWAVRKEDKELLKFLNDEIAKMKKDGSLSKMQVKWFGKAFNDLPDVLHD